MNRFKLRVAASQAGQRLDHYLSENLPIATGKPVSKSKIRKLIVAGAVYLNGKRVRIASKALIGNAVIEVLIDWRKFERDGPPAVTFSLDSSRVLYEDEWLIAIDKPPRLPTQPTLDEARDNLFASVQRFLRARAGAGTCAGTNTSTVDAYVGLHHRLDRDTSGVILFTKKKEANAGVAALFTQHEIQKTYQALARSAEAPPASWVVKNFLARAKGTGKKARFTAVKSGGNRAETQFARLEYFPFHHVAFIEARPRTGRTHQIRVHLAEKGMPILGDATYGSAAGDPLPVARLQLHAANLTFTHPVLKTEISIQSPLPKDFLQCLTELRANLP